MKTEFADKGFRNVEHPHFPGMCANSYLSVRGTVMEYFCSNCGRTVQPLKHPGSRMFFVVPRHKIPTKPKANLRRMAIRDIAELITRGAA